VVRDPEGDRKHQVKVLLDSSQSTARGVESPIRRRINYPPEVTLYGESIDFGYLERPNFMVVKATKSDPRAQAIKLSLNLHRREIEVYFPVLMHSKGTSTTRAYRFFVALDDEFSLAVKQHPDTSTASLILHVRSPPCYSRQLKEAMGMSHAADSRKWTLDDTWTRQTDIVDDKETYAKIDRSPVGVRKLDNSINVARWTTFRIVVKDNKSTTDQNTLFLRALEDFNVPVTTNPSFKVIRGPAEDALVWKLLDASGEVPRTLHEQLSSVYLPFELRYQLEVCISHGWLNEYTLNEEFLKHLMCLPVQRAKQMLIHVDSYQQRVYDPMDVFADLRYSKPVRARGLPASCIEIHHATVTATGIIFHTPSVEITNRIIRKYQRYSDRFLRVRFEDDPYRGRTRLYPAMNKKMCLIFERVRRTLRNGILLGDRHYTFLAWGNSQLREHGAYFFATTESPHISSETIRASMGVFDREKVVARRAARMGQCFSTTKPISAVSKRSWKKEPIPDIVNGPYTFTDGVGKLSPITAQLVHACLQLKGPVPSAFQFRLGGCKGVLALDPTLQGLDVKIRPSQYKFDCDSDELEIIRVSEFWQPFLNRQLILVLSDLGVPDRVFLQKQEACIQELDRSLVDDSAALRTLRDNVDPNLITLSIASMVEDGFRHTNEPFVTSLLLLHRAWTLKYLKEKAKIPISKGAFVLGVVDETATLRGHINDAHLPPDASREERQRCLPEIFVQYTDPHTGKRIIKEGLCILARNPSLHRGDIRVVMAVDCPHLHHHYNVVVMPGTGDLDLPSMCSGGDLDGDDYIVAWDPELIPSDWNPDAFDYEAPPPVTKEQITTDDIINFFYDYMQNDYLGRIAHAHLAAADYLDDGIRSEQCLELVKLHSMAVDYPKTGVPAAMPRALERTKWPHFMEKKGSGQYRSRKILGQLYDAVEKVNFQPNWDGAFDERILSRDLPEGRIVEEVRKLKRSFDESMRRIMAQHKIRTEFEVWSTFVLHHSKAARDFKFHEEIGQHSKTLKDQYYEAFVQEAGGREFERLAPFAVAAYHVTYDEVREVQEAIYKQEQDSDDSAETPIEMPFISFPWVLQDVLGKVAKSPVPSRDAAEADSVATKNDLRTALNGLTTNGVGGGKWLPYGEHFPDPYEPAVSIVGVGSENGVEDGDAHVPVDNDKAVISPEKTLARPRRPSSGCLAPLEPMKLALRPAQADSAPAAVEDVEQHVFADPASMSTNDLMAVGFSAGDDDDDYNY
jgi:RNA-dependent RNA polymerase